MDIHRQVVAHELGHNFGIHHNREAADVVEDTNPSTGNVDRLARPSDGYG